MEQLTGKEVAFQDCNYDNIESEDDEDNCDYDNVDSE